MLLSKAVVFILFIVLGCVWYTQGGCIHLRSKIENPATTRLKSENSLIPWRSTRNPTEPIDHNAEPRDIDISISICSSESSAYDRDEVDSSGIDSFEVVLPSLKVLSNKKTPLRFRVPDKSTHSHRETPSKSSRPIYRTNSKKAPPSLNKYTSDAVSSSPEGSYERIHPPTKQSYRSQPPREPPSLYEAQHHPPIQQPQYSPSYTSVNEPSYPPPYNPPQQPPSCNLSPPPQQWFSPPHSSSYNPSTHPHSRPYNHPLTRYLPSSPHDLPSNPIAPHSFNEPKYSLAPPMEPPQSTSLQLYQPRRQPVQQQPDNEYLHSSYTPVESQPIYMGHALTSQT